jgi:hypothetical protein
MKNSSKDFMIAFGAVMTLLTVWSFLDLARGKKAAKKEHKILHAKLDAILQKQSGQA